jgi:endonuclease/exonuclease/phosphatase (EEP) superfamily protein YafD
MPLAPAPANLPPTGLRRLLRVALGLAVLASVVIGVAPFLGAVWPPLRLFENFSAQLGAATLILLLGTLLLRMWRWAALAALTALWHVSLVVPFVLPMFAQQSAVVPASGSPLELLSLNLWNKSDHMAETVDYLSHSGADVIGTVETTREWRAALQPLEKIYPYHIDCVGVVHRCGVALFSKLPIRASFADRINGELPIVAWATVDWEGKPLTVAELQLLDPLIGLSERFQDHQAAVMTGYFSSFAGDLILMGDFNSAPWSRLQMRFRAATGLDNRGRLAFTWPSWAPMVFRLPIDQIFSRGAVAVRGYRAGPAVGSDHLPVLADIYRTAQ